MIKDADYWIRKLGLEPHPEGGFYRQTYRADIVLEGLPERFSGPRAASTAIYFLLAGADFSAFHRLQSDELWHFYVGAPVTVHVIDADDQYADDRYDDRYSEIRLGGDPEAGEVLQAVVKAGCWFASQLFAAEPKDGQAFALVGCTVAPGFDFEDFELAERAKLIELYPQHRDVITRMTRV
jgi:uncharacterized protein